MEVKTMRKSEFFRRFNVYVDLAVEAHELLQGEGQTEIPGVKMEKTDLEHATVTLIKIENEQGVKEMGRPIGTYITIDAPEIRQNNYLVHKAITEILAENLNKILDLQENTSILIVGLGNWNATPDALGPRVVNKSLVTRHLFHYAPENVKGQLRQVSAVTPGVLGLTGIETVEIVKGIVDNIKPDIVIAIDALAASSLDRIGTSIQLTDTGINPGSGVGNKRAAINEETLGCKVVAIGLPTVVNAAVIAHNTLESFFDYLKTSPTLYKMYKGINPQVVEDIIQNVLSPYSGNLSVTPKEIDDLIGRASKIIAGALSISLHPGIDSEDYEMYLQ